MSRRSGGRAGERSARVAADYRAAAEALDVESRRLGLDRLVVLTRPAWPGVRRGALDHHFDLAADERMAAAARRGSVRSRISHAGAELTHPGLTSHRARADGMGCRGAIQDTDALCH